MARIYLYVLLALFLIGVFTLAVRADFGVEGEAGVDDNHLDRPRYVRISSNGSMLISDDHRILEVDAAGQIVWQIQGTFCDITWIDDLNWAALNGTSTSACDTIQFSNGTTVSLPHQVQRLHPAGEDLVIGAMHQNITRVSRSGTSIKTCEFVTGYISDLDLDHYLYDGTLYSYNLTGCSSSAVATPAGDSVYSFQAMPNQTFTFGIGWNNGSREVVWESWSSWITSFPEDLAWNGTHLAVTDLNDHVVRVYQLEQVPDPDRDGDGVVDSIDHCPDDWGNATDLRGCPDTDGDGIADTNDPCPTDPQDGCVDLDGDGYNATVDACPATWGNSTIDRLGCPDSDGDGTSDLNDACPDDPLDLCGDPDGDGYYGSNDKCPTTWGNSTVDQLGCPDRDGDGWSDDGDTFPDDPSEWLDGDGDGVGDNRDACPTTWGNSTSPPGCPDRDGDGLADSIDPCPDDPTNTCDDPVEVGEVVVLQHLLEVTNRSATLTVELNVSVSYLSADIIGVGQAQGGWVELEEPWYYWWNYTGLEPNTTYQFLFTFANATAMEVLRLNATTLADPGGDGGDGDGADGNNTPGGDGDGDPPGLLEATPAGIPMYVVLLSFVALVGLSMAIMMNVKPEPGLRIPDPFLRTDELDELEAMDQVADHTEPFASPDLFGEVQQTSPRAPALPLVPVPGKEFIEAPSLPPGRLPYLAIQVAEADDLPVILVSLEQRMKPRICEENKQVLRDVMDLEKRLRQLRDSGDIAPRKYEQILRDVEELKRAVQNLTPAMERRGWDV